MITRRALLSLAGAGPALLSCSDPDPDPEMSGKTQGPPPWHMWSTTQLVNVSGTQLPVTGFLPVALSGQLASVQYARPETWSCLFGVKVVNVVAPFNVPIEVDFQLIIGVGRATLVIPAFAVYNTTAAPTPGQSGFTNAGYFSAADGNNFNSGFVLPTIATGGGIVTAGQLMPPVAVDHFPAETIQCSASAFYKAVGTGCSAQLEITALFAPRTHMRPEWFEQRFPGGEDHGQ